MKTAISIIAIACLCACTTTNEQAQTKSTDNELEKQLYWYRTENQQPEPERQWPESMERTDDTFPMRLWGIEPKDPIHTNFTNKGFWRRFLIDLSLNELKRLQAESEDKMTDDELWLLDREIEQKEITAEIAKGLLSGELEIAHTNKHGTIWYRTKSDQNPPRRRKIESESQQTPPCPVPPRRRKSE